MAFSLDRPSLPRSAFGPSTQGFQRSVRALWLTAVAMGAWATGCATSGRNLMGGGFRAGEAIVLRQNEAGAPAVVLVDQRFVTQGITRSGGWTHQAMRRAVYIVNRDGLAFAQVQIPYAEGEIIYDLQARTILPDGLRA